MALTRHASLKTHSDPVSELACGNQLVKILLCLNRHIHLHTLRGKVLLHHSSRALRRSEGEFCS